MTKIIGLDLGTNSIGWGVIDTHLDGNQIIAKGVHIFSEGVKSEKGVESSKAAERTGYRSARRIKFRRKLRKLETLRVLIENGLCPLSMDELAAWKRNKKDYPQNQAFLEWLSTDDATDKNPYKFRAKASTEKVTPFELGRALYHIAQRRGFLSNRLDQGDDGALESVRQEYLRAIEPEDSKSVIKGQLDMLLEQYEEDEDKSVKAFAKKIDKTATNFASASDLEFKTNIMKILESRDNLGVVKRGIADLTDQMQAGGFTTIGQYFNHLYDTQRHNSENKIRTRYTAREEHYLSEFKIICSVQGLQTELAKSLENAIFYQRKLRSQKGLVGKCVFEKTKARCPVSHPLFEEYRALQFINGIKMKDESGKFRFLTKEERKRIWPKFIRKSKPTFNFEDIIKELKPKAEKKDFNYYPTDPVSGCPTIAGLVNIFGENYGESILSCYAHNHGKTAEEAIHDIWHVLSTFDKTEKLVEFGEMKLGLDNKNARKFASILLKKDYASLSLKAIKKILPYLREGHIYSYAVFLANIEAVVGNEIWKDPENRRLIQNEIKRIIESHAREMKLEGIVNELIANFREEYGNAHSSYLLDDRDKKEVREKILSVIGAHAFERSMPQEQAETIDWVEKHYQQQLRKSAKGEFMARPRLDERILTFLSDQFGENAVQKSNLFHPSDIDMYQPAKSDANGKRYLGSPMTNSIRNPMAMRTLHQLRKLINTLTKEGVIDEYTKVHIELARELNDANKRKAYQDFQRDQKLKRNNAKTEIEKHLKAQMGRDVAASDSEIIKYLLWEEQKGICLYTGKSIGIGDFVGGNPKFDIEHTIPRSQSFDDSMVNLTLCDVDFNRNIKKNKIPTELANHETIVSRFSDWNAVIKELDKKVKDRKKAKGIETKDQKDKRIRQKHYYQMQLDYWRGKVHRFMRKDVPEGFKNSQLVDTGIITRYARGYMASLFHRVNAVKGDAVAAFRKAWGVQSEFEKKARANHIHHCIDAIVIACMTKDKYDRLAELYHADEENRTNEKKEVLQKMKPWPTFTQDILALEQEVLVSHHAPDNMKKKAKKKLRKRGKIVMGKDGKPIFQRGDTARGSLHQDTMYGAIRLPEDQEEIKYVIRKPLDALKSTEVDKIVDEEVKKIVKQAIDDKVIGLASTAQQKNKINGKVWRNEAKGIEIKKVRIIASVSDPLVIKQHSTAFASKHPHKQNYYATNDSNYAMAVYEARLDDGKILREFSILNNMDAAKLMKHKSGDEGVFPIKYTKMKSKKSIDFQLMGILKRGTSVLFYKNDPPELQDCSQDELCKRLYVVKKFGKDGRALFQFHQDARNDDQLKADYEETNKTEAPKSLTNGVSYFDGSSNPAPRLLLSPVNMNFVCDGFGMKVHPNGKVEVL